MSNQPANDRTNKPPRRPFFGPGLLTALVIAAGTVVYQHWPEIMHRNRPPVVESHILRGGAPSAPFTPEITVLLQPDSDLGLSVAQSHKLEALTKEWRQQVKLLKDDMDRAEADFRRFAESRTKSGKVSMTELQRRAAPLSELSREYIGVKVQYWQRAMQILTAAQRSAADKLRHPVINRH